MTRKDNPKGGYHGEEEGTEEGKEVGWLEDPETGRRIRLAPLSYGSIAPPNPQKAAAHPLAAAFLFLRLTGFDWIAGKNSPCERQPIQTAPGRPVLKFFV